MLSGLNAQPPAQYYELQYEARNTQYHALVILDNQARGVIRTRFYDRILHEYQLTEQKVQVTGSRGMETLYRLSSECARDIATGKLSIYPADNFYMATGPQQEVRFDRLNEQGGKSAVKVRILQGNALMNLLPTFGWDAPETDYPVPGIRNDAGRAVKLAVNEGSPQWQTMYLHNNYMKTVDQYSGATYRVRIYTPGKGYTSYQAKDTLSYYIDWNPHSGMYELYKAEGKKKNGLAETLAFVE